MLAREQLVAVQAAVARLHELIGSGLSGAERAQATGLEQAARRLVEIANAVEAEGLTVTGSMGQLRPHPLLAEERGLRREISESLNRLEFRVGQRAQLERMRDLTRSKPTANRQEPVAAAGRRSPSVAPRPKAQAKPGRKPAS